MGEKRRLGSWKEIAAYLGWSERTAQRYAREKGLPIHKMDGLCSRVYAFAEDLDHWLARSEAAAQPFFTLVVIRGENAGTRLSLDRSAVTIGRSFECRLQLDQPGVSRLHARLTHADGALRLEDLGSKNGTFLNNQPVTEPTLLREGDRIGLGRVVELRLESGRQPETADEAPVSEANDQ